MLVIRFLIQFVHVVLLMIYELNKTYLMNIDSIESLSEGKSAVLDNSTVEGFSVLQNVISRRRHSRST